MPWTGSSRRPRAGSSPASRGPRSGLGSGAWRSWCSTPSRRAPTRLEAWKRAGAEPEHRPDAVLQAIEAGTGTGKSLGYLIPALASGRHPVLVSTRTKQLQRQLLEDDLPRARGILGRDVQGGAGQGPGQLPLQDRLGGPGGPSARRS